MENKKPKKTKKSKSEFSEVEHDILPKQAREELALHETTPEEMTRIPMRDQLGVNLRKLKEMFYDQAKMLGELHGADIDIRVYFTIKEKED